MFTNAQVDILKKNLTFCSYYSQAHHCPKCSREMKFSETGFQLLPILLSCSHIICEQCVRFGGRKFIKCDICKTITQLDSTSSSEQYIYNNYLSGILSLKKMVFPTRLKYYKQRECETPAIEENSTNSIECIECSKTDKLLFCEQCDTFYCEHCFNKIHKSAKALKGHKPIDIKAKLDVSINSNKSCKKHGNEIIFFCKDCSEPCCTTCNNDIHENHEMVTIYVENEKYRDQLKVFIRKLMNARQSSNQAQKILQHLKTKHENNSLSVLEKISKHFVYIHGILQNAELELYQIVKKHYDTLNESVLEHEAKLIKSEKEIQNILKEFQEYSYKMPKNVYILNEIETKSKLLDNMPTGVQIDGLNSNPFQFEVYNLNDFINMLSSNCSVIFDECLARINLTHDCGNELDIIDETLINLQINDTEKLTEKSQISLYDEQQSLNSQKITKKLLIEEVYVTHIKTPTYFFVQFSKYKKDLNLMLEICKKEGVVASKPEIINENKIYLIFNSFDKSYNRGRVIERAKDNKDLFRVLFLDYGKTSFIHRARFRVISKVLESEPFFAKLCCIYNIDLHTHSRDECAQLMADTIANKSVEMLILKETPNIFYVDLFISRDYALSLRDALLYNKYVDESIESNIDSKIIDDIEFYKKNMYFKKMKKICKNKFKVTDTFKVTTKHIINPNEFYAVKSDHLQQIVEMEKNIQSFYEKNRNYVYLPQINLLCVVLYENRWVRCRIIEILSNTLCKVKLTEYGIEQNVSSKNLMYLDGQFVTVNEGAIRCSLNDIFPKQEDNYEYTDETINHFKNLCMSSLLQIFIENINSSDETYLVSLYIVQKHREININLLIFNKNFALEDNNKKIFTQGKLDKQMTKNTVKVNDKNKLTEITMLNIITPSEFYIFLNKYENGLVKLHETIQSSMVNKSQKNFMKDNWNPNDKCLVYTTTVSYKRDQWYRGKIIEKLNSKSFKVYLRDHGIMVNVSIEKIAVIDDTFNIIGDGSIKCSLACVKPTCGQNIWLSAATDEFKYVTDKYERLYVSLYGTKGEDNSLPIILWGFITTFSDALEPSTCEWTNVNQKLVDIGVCHLSEKFDEDRLCIENFEKDLGFDDLAAWIQEISEINVSKKSDENNEINISLEDPHLFSNEVIEIDEWLPPQKINKTVFCAIPTYVDNNAVIYLHDYSRNHVVRHISNMINDKFQQSQEEHNHYWRLGQPCIAKYHFDERFYRAIVVNNDNKNSLKIEFIDYGNVEDCSPSELRSKIILGYVPPQASKYYLSNIKPVDSTWSVKALDFLHSQIIGVLSSIRVDVDKMDDSKENKSDAIPCMLKINGIDIADVLVNEKYAVFDKKSEFKEVVCKNIDLFELNKSMDKTLTNNQPQNVEMDKKIEKNKISPEYYIGESLYSAYDNDFNNLSLNNSPEINIHRLKKEKMEQKEIIENKSNTSKKTTINDEIDMIMEYLNELEKSNEQTNSEISFDNDKIDWTSTMIEDQLNNYVCDNMMEFKQIKISDDVHGFYCGVTKVLSPFDIYISPHFESHIVNYNDMTNVIQAYALKSSTIENPMVGMSCLAIDDTDFLWYRAVIKEINPLKNKAIVLFVDRVEISEVDLKKLKTISSKCKKYPLRNVHVKLNGVKCHPRIRESDIIYKLKHLLERKKIYIKIIKIENSIPLVELYSSDNCEKLLYKDLIKEKYFIRN